MNSRGRLSGASNTELIGGSLVIRDGPIEGGQDNS